MSILLVATTSPGPGVCSDMRGCLLSVLVSVRVLGPPWLGMLLNIDWNVHLVLTLLGILFFWALFRTLTQHPHVWSDGGVTHEAAHFECAGAGFFVRFP